MLEVSLDEGSTVRALSAVIGQSDAVPRALGAIMLAQAQRKFDQQGSSESRWPPRAVPNLAGILSDLNAGRTPPARRFDDRPALVDTGTLRRSLAVEVVRLGTTVEIRVGTNVPYADDLQRGATREIPITADARARVPEVMRRHPEHAERLARLLKGETLKIQIPPRAFLDVTDEDADELEEELTALVNERLDRGSV